MRVLLTGNRGFCGRHLQAAFEGRGDEVYGIDLLDGRDALNFFRDPWWRDEERFDLAVHCAAHIGGRAGIDGSPLAVGTNLALDSWFFRWLEQSETPRAVYFSSSAAYPAATQNSGYNIALSEDMAGPVGAFLGVPDATYGWAKLTGEMLAEHARSAGRHVLVVRPFSGYGPGQALDYPFPSFIDRAVRIEDPFTIWGNGNQVRDWVHIDDVVGAVLALLEAGEEGPVNIGRGRPTTFTELAKMVTFARGYNPDFKYLVGAPAGVYYRVADTARLRRFYKPTVTLEEGIRRALDAAL